MTEQQEAKQPKKKRAPRPAAERAISAIMGMGIGALGKFAIKLIEADAETASYLANKILTNIIEVEDEE